MIKNFEEQVDTRRWSTLIFDDLAASAQYVEEVDQRAEVAKMETDDGDPGGNIWTCPTPTSWPCSRSSRAPNRIAVARRDFDNAAGQHHPARPADLDLGLNTFYSSAKPMALFSANAAAQTAPTVSFDNSVPGAAPGSAPPAAPANTAGQ